jgi:hypothetical protein
MVSSLKLADSGNKWLNLSNFLTISLAPIATLATVLEMLVSVFYTQ